MTQLYLLHRWLIRLLWACVFRFSIACYCKPFILFQTIAQPNRGFILRKFLYMEIEQTAYFTQKSSIIFLFLLEIVDSRQMHTHAHQPPTQCIQAPNQTPTRNPEVIPFLHIFGLHLECVVRNLNFPYASCIQHSTSKNPNILSPSIFFVSFSYNPVGCWIGY